MHATQKRILVKRRTAFRKALLDEGTTAKAFAEERLGITETSLYRTLRDPKSSRRVTAAIDALIAKHGHAA